MARGGGGVVVEGRPKPPLPVPIGVVDEEARAHGAAVRVTAVAPPVPPLPSVVGAVVRAEGGTSPGGSGVASDLSQGALVSGCIRGDQGPQVNRKRDMKYNSIQASSREIVS